MVAVFIGSIKGLIFLNSQVGITKNELFYEIIPDELTFDKWLYVLASFFSIVMSGIFVVPVSFLFYI